MADINATDLTPETAATLDGSEEFVMFDNVEGKRGELDTVGDYIVQHCDADGNGNTAAQLAGGAQADATAALGDIGDISNLITTDKSDLVHAVNEVKGQADDNTETLETKANIDGAYESLTAGNAEQLISDSRVTDKTPYIFRRAGGGLDIGDRKYTTLVGADAVVNQLQQNITSYIYQVGDGTGLNVSVSNGYIDISGTAVGRTIVAATPAATGLADHVYLFSATDYNGYKWGRIDFGFTQAKAFIHKHTAAFSIGVRFDIPDGETVNIHTKVNTFDLTAYFGSPTIADTAYTKEQTLAGSGIAWLKSQGFDFNKYRAYNAGSLESVNPSAMKTVGFNQWDGETESGYIYNGSYGVSSSYWRTKNFIKVLPNTEYCFANCSGDWQINGFDAEQNFVSAVTATTSGSNKIAIMPENCYYIKFYQPVSISADTVCVNISKTTGTPKNGDYRQYSEREYDLGNVPLHGKFDLVDGNIVAVGDTRDSDGTVNREWKLIDASTLNWYYNSTYQVFYAYITGTGLEAKKAGRTNIMCAKYVTVDKAYQDMSDKEMAGTLDTGVNVKDSAYSDPADFKTALSGVYFLYEKATPTTDIADPFTNPQVVDADGTEEFTVSNDVPVGNVTEYPENLREKLEDLPEIPSAPSTDGTYTLKATVSGGAITYSWE